MGCGSISLGRVVLVLDGPTAATVTVPMITGLQDAGFSVKICLRPEASMYLDTPAAMILTGEDACAWPMGDENLANVNCVLFAGVSIHRFSERYLVEDCRKLEVSGASLIIAPTVLDSEPLEDADIPENMRDGSGRWQVLLPKGDRHRLGILGTVGLASIERCVEACISAMASKCLSGKHVLVTAGPTAEDFDPVRFVSNRSTGRMGVALATAAARFGADVTLVHGPMSWHLPVNERVECVAVRSAKEMNDAVMARIQQQDIAVLCAAVADFMPAEYSDFKIKKHSKGDEGMTLKLKRTPDILASIGALEARPFLVGFAAESDHVETNAEEKMRGKHCDMLCANDITEDGSGFAVSTNRVTVFTKSGDVVRLPQMSKIDVARKIMMMVSEKIRDRE